jgi:hypothetical protein
MTAKQLDAYLRRKGSPLAGQGATFIQAGRRYGVSPALLVAISGAESSFGKISSGSHNPFGWGPGIDFPSWAAGIVAVAKGLRSGYLDQGRKTVASIGAKWAPSSAANDPTNLNSNWVTNVSGFLKELGGGGLATSAPAGQGQPSSPLESSAPGTPPDLSGAALGTLGEIASGRPVMPSESLDALVQSVAASGGPGGAQAPAQSIPAPLRGGKGITFSGQKFTHQTDGLPGYPAVDIFAKPGTPFLAPEDGQIIRISGHKGTTSGNVFGQSIYFRGKSGRTYFITHLGTVASLGRYRRGSTLGTVSRWDSGSSHAHVGVHG